LTLKPQPSNKIEIENLLGLQEAYVRLNQLAQAYLFKLELSVGEKLPGIAGRTNKNDSKVFDELKFGILSETLTPEQILKLIDIEGLYINEVSINDPGSWQIKGLQYVKR
ncbi:hypothetical protein CYQ88_08235, partial [Hydrogenovibrio sp. SC-1]|uniref:hypothetical protein n=1 Tax=Hydrogenovibrio sp. SC-1 TaxID=2065820 RepID=UPI000CA969A7